MSAAGRALAIWLIVCIAVAGCVQPAHSETATLHVLPDAGVAPLLRAIETARSSIDLEIYLLLHQPTIAALTSARARGVQVRVLLEERPVGDGAGNSATIEALRRAGVEARWADPAYRLTHAKMLIVDRTTVWVMTANLTNSSVRFNRELLVELTSRDAVAEVGAIFDADWNRSGPAPTPAAAIGSSTLLLGPAHARERLTELIDGAMHTLDVAATELVDGRIIIALANAEARGVEVRVIMSPPPGDGEDRSARARETLRRAGAESRMLSEPYVHAKFIVVDARRLYVGSVNLTSASLDANRELGVILTSEPAVELARDTFERDWRAAR